MTSSSHNKPLKPTQLTNFVEVLDEQAFPAHRHLNSSHSRSAHFSRDRALRPRDLQIFVEEHTQRRQSTQPRQLSDLPDLASTMGDERADHPAVDAVALPATGNDNDTDWTPILTQEQWDDINQKYAAAKKKQQQQQQKLQAARDAWSACLTVLLLLSLSIGALVLPFYSVSDPDFNPAQSTPLARDLEFLKHTSEQGWFDDYLGNLQAFWAGQWQAYHLLCSIPQPADVRRGTADVRRGTAWYREGYEPFIQNTTDGPPNFRCESTRADWSGHIYAQGLEGYLSNVAKTMNEGHTVASNISIDLQQKFRDLHESLSSFHRDLQMARRQEAALSSPIRRAIRVFESPDAVTGCIWYRLWVGMLRGPWLVDKLLLPWWLGEPLYFDLVATEVPTVAKRLHAFTELDTFTEELRKFSGLCYASIDRTIDQAAKLGVADFEFSEGMQALRKGCDWANGTATTGSWAAEIRGMSTKGLAEYLRQGLDQRDFQSSPSSKREWVRPGAIASTKDVVMKLEAGVAIKHLAPGEHNAAGDC